MLNLTSRRNLPALLLALLALQLAPVAHAAGTEDGKTREAVENAVEKEKQREAQGSDKNDVGETEFSAQDCSELNDKKKAGTDVEQKDLDECEIENTE